MAALIQAEMGRLGYDKVWTDKAGNVVGMLAGGRGPSLMLNGHMDHVDPGDQARWRHPPFGGEIHEGALWGRGAADMKGALAAMIHAGGIVKSLGAAPVGDLYVTAVVQEEVGSPGARVLAQHLPVARAIVGEASGNQLRRGHRGRVELIVHLEGRSVHASMPDLGINPHFSMAHFVSALPALDMAATPDYGASSVAPTRVVSEPHSANITPGLLKLHLDWRNVPGERPAEIVAKLGGLLADCLEPGCRGRIEIDTKELVTYTGMSLAYLDTFPSFTTPADHPWLAEARVVLQEVLDRPVDVDVWRFATDGGHFAEAGMTVIGFGPGDARVVHTVEERVPLDDLVASLAGYVALSLI